VYSEEFLLTAGVPAVVDVGAEARLSVAIEATGNRQSEAGCVAWVSRAGLAFFDFRPCCRVVHHMEGVDGRCECLFGTAPLQSALAHPC